MSGHPELGYRSNSAVVGSAPASFLGAGSAPFASGAGTDGATSNASRLLFSGLSSEVSSSPAVVVSGFYPGRPPHCPVDASSLVFFAAPKAYKRVTFIRRIGPTLHHNEVEQQLQDTFSLQRTQLTTLHQSIQSTLFPNYNGVFKKKSE